MATEPRNWTVLSWNVRGTAQPDLDKIATAIRVESPDVVVLQEIRRGQATQLAATLEMKFTWALKHYPFSPLLKNAAEGLAIMTPHALDAAGHAEVSTGKSKWTYHRRIAQWALVGKPDTSAYRVYNLHLAPGNQPAERRSQAVTFSEIVASHGDAPPAVVAGDFNDDKDPSVIFALPGVEHVSPPPTNPSAIPTQALDHVLLPADARDVSTTVPAGSAEWATLSDHLPITVRFTLDWVAGDFV